MRGRSSSLLFGCLLGCRAEPAVTVTAAPRSEPAPVVMPESAATPRAAGCPIVLPAGPAGAAPAEGPAFVLVDGVGLLRIADGEVKVAVAMADQRARGTVMAVGPQGELWLSDWQGVRVLGPDGALRTVRTVRDGPRYEHMAVRSATEVWAVRASNNPHPSIGDVTSTSYLWTQTAARTAGQHVTVRISDGASLGQADTAATVYARCIWPNQRGDVLEGRNCYGPPDSECFTTSGGLVADTYDRVALDAAAANQECRFSGGHLPSHREFLDMVHGGAPNGSDQWQWTSEADIYFNGSTHLYGYDVVKWSGVGTGGWEYATTVGTWVYGYNLYRFRCVYTPELR